MISKPAYERGHLMNQSSRNDKFDYFVKTSKKIYGYSKDNYRPGREVIYIILYDKANFDKDYFVSQVLTAFNDMIPDNALIWEENQAAV